MKKYCLLIIWISSFNTLVLKAAEDGQKESEKEISLWSEISTGAQSLTDSTLEKAGELSGNISQAYDNAITFSKESLNSFLVSLDESVILMEKLGYDITDVYINAGVVPDLAFKVARVKAISLQAQCEILQAQGNGVVMKYIVKRLNQAYAMEVKGYHIKDVKIRLTLTPGATVHFVRD
jgi:hypothetical protein